MLKRWRCEDCDTVSKEAELLRAPSPFDPSDDLVGCPACRSVNALVYVCEAPGCKEPACMGTPTPDGYLTTCWKHRPNQENDA